MSVEVDEPFKWEFSWRGWDGLHLSVSQQTAFADPAKSRAILNLDEVKFTSKLGIKLEVDAAAFSTTGELTGFDNGAELRSAKIKARGAGILVVPFTYKIDLGYTPSTFTITQANITVPGLPYIGAFKFGYFTPEMGLQLVTGSWDIPFMEPAAPLQAIAPGTQAGFQIGRPFFDARGTWTLGVYGDGGLDSEFGFASENLANVNGRVTWLAIDGIDLERPASNHLLHLGLSLSRRTSGNGQLRFRTRPESRLAPYVVDTGVINANGGSTSGIEVAWVNGAFSAQAEAIRTTARDDVLGSLTFGGFYAMASWFLTGESRPYDRGAGAFGSVIPTRQFAFGPDGGWGALQFAMRYSYTDLNDKGIQGGRLSLAMTSLNWYLRQELKMMFEVGGGTVRSGASNGTMFIAQMRVGVDF